MGNIVEFLSLADYLMAFNKIKEPTFIEGFMFYFSLLHSFLWSLIIMSLPFWILKRMFNGSGD